MLATRVIARLDVKGMNVVKGRRFEGLKVIGGLYDCAQRAQAQGADEILYVDIVASLYGRQLNGEAIEEVSRDLFIPLTVCGGIRTLDDVRTALRLGADKVGINTAAVGQPHLLYDIAHRYGEQAVVVSIEAKDVTSHWDVHTHGGREPTGMNVAFWADKAVRDYGAGEILLTSIDRDGCQAGADLELIKKVSTASPKAPLIYSGGIAGPADGHAALQAGADAIAIASTLYTYGVHEYKGYLHSQGVPVRLDYA